MPKQLIAWLCATIVLFSSAWADEPSDTDDQEILVGDLRIPIEEIIVSDYRRRTIDEVPASITKLSDADVRDMSAQHFEDFVNIIPNLNWSGDGHRARYIQIRGVGELEQYQGAPNPSIGFLVDDIDFSGIGSIATMFDVESIEVLRGSQGSRYGANALGGLIYLRSMQPSDRREGRVQLGVGDDSMRSLGIAFGGSVDDEQDTTFRFSAHKQVSDGFRRNSYLGRDDTNGRDETTVRFKLNHSPQQSGYGIDAALVYVKADNGYDAFALDNGYTMLSDKPGKDAQESLGGSLNVEWLDVGSGSLRSITSFATSDIDFSFDADWGNDDSWAPVLYDYISVSDRERQTISQEIRYEGESVVTGIYALRLRDDLASLNQGDYYDPFYDFADTLDYAFDSEFESTNVAAFGQFYREIGQASSFTAGLRIERRSIDYADTDGLSESSSETLWGGELSISHEFDDGTGYVSVARGYKASGFNLGVVPDEWRRFGD
ncbi:MAG: TonB-dependent receptor plug domain-containing protein [Pseudomonadota bacterium]